MFQSHSEVAELAEFIAEENLNPKGSVNLERITRKNDIGIYYDDFESYFIGMLRHDKGSFDIFVNSRLNKSKKYPRTRFTIAHELGHYFIDDHRNQLLKGLSLSYDRKLTYFTNIPVEREANHFATNLLMPRSRFVQDINQLAPGINSIKQLSEKYKSSIASTAIQYKNLVGFSCCIINWSNKQEFNHKNYSSSWFNRFRVVSNQLVVDISLHQRIFEDFIFNSTSTIQGRVWQLYPGIMRDSRDDAQIQVETMDLQPYGFISIVILL